MSFVSSPVPNKGIYIHTRSVELYIHIFKLKALRISQTNKMVSIKQFHAIMREAAMSVFIFLEHSVAHEPSPNILCLARKSITLLFFHKARHRNTARKAHEALSWLQINNFFHYPPNIYETFFIVGQAFPHLHASWHYSVRYHAG